MSKGVLLGLMIVAIVVALGIGCAAYSTARTAQRDAYKALQRWRARDDG